MSDLFVRAAALFYLAMAAAGLAWLSWGGYGFEVLHFQSDWWIDVAAGLSTGLGIIALWNVAERLLPSARALAETLAQAIPKVDTLQIITLAVTSAIGEEILFRGAAQSAFGPVVATVAFGLLHGFMDRRFILWVVFATLAGAVFAALTAFLGNLVAATIAHALVNGVNIRRLVREFG